MRVDCLCSQGTIDVSRIRRGVEDGVQKRDTYAVVTDRKPTALWESTVLSEALYTLVGSLFLPFGCCCCCCCFCSG